MSALNRDSVRRLRRKIFSTKWPLDGQLGSIASTVSSHRFLHNPAGQYPYLYLTRFVKALTEAQSGVLFSNVSVLDWGCGKGHVTKLLRDLGPRSVESCDVRSGAADSSFSQATPIIDRFGIQVRPLEHESQLPYADETFDVVLSVGVLEHVGDDHASLGEIARILKPGGLFFCFFLPTRLSWTQAVARWRGNNYHDRLYTEGVVNQLVRANGLHILDFWYRQMFPKNQIRYPGFRLFEKLDQFITEATPLRYFATDIEFVCTKPVAQLTGGKIKISATGVPVF